MSTTFGIPATTFVIPAKAGTQLIKNLNPPTQTQIHRKIPPLRIRAFALPLPWMRT